MSHWSGESIRRFILFVATALDKREQQDMIRSQVDRFRAVGIHYEVWSASTMANKLRPHHAIVRQYCGEYWVETLCGNRMPTFNSGVNQVDQSLAFVETAPWYFA